MNRTLRRWHLGLVSGLAPVAVATLVTAIMVRRQAPDNPVPAALRPPMPAGGREVARANIRGDGLALEARRLVLPEGRRELELVPLADTRAADVLVYLATRPSADLDSATLLGSLGGPDTLRFALPAMGDSARSTLLFYSPAVGRVLARDSGTVTP